MLVAGIAPGAAIGPGVTAVTPETLKSSRARVNAWLPGNTLSS